MQSRTSFQEEPPRLETTLRNHPAIGEIPPLLRHETGRVAPLGPAPVHTSTPIVQQPAVGITPAFQEVLGGGGRAHRSLPHIGHGGAKVRAPRKVG